MSSSSITNYKTNDKIELHRSRPMNISATYMKLSVYNALSSNPLQKYVFYLKNVRIVEKNNKIAKIAVCDKDFTNYLDRLDAKIYEMMKLGNKKKSYSTEQFYPNTIVAYVAGVKIYGRDSVNDVSEENEINVLIELSDVLCNDDEYWLNYKIKQIKINEREEISIDKCDDPVHIPIPPPPPISISQQIHNNRLESRNSNMQPSLPAVITRARMVTVDLLAEQLKKINKKRIINEMNSVMESIKKDNLHLDLEMPQDLNTLPVLKLQHKAKSSPTVDRKVQS